MSPIQTLMVALATAGIVACGSGPASTETTSTTSRARTDSGGEVRTSSTQTTEVGDDGTQTVDRTERTQSSSPPE
jgi:hypothetical protein